MSYSDDLYSQLKILDKILMSNNPTVQDMLEQTLVLAEVSKEEDTEENPLGLYTRQTGPIEQLLNDVSNLRNRLQQLEYQIINITNRQNTWTTTGTTTGGYITPTWAGTSATEQTSGTYWGPTTSEWDYGNTGYSYNVTYPSVADLGSLLSGTTMKTSGVVGAATEDDPESFNLVDPDTGETMTVKYK